LYEARGHKWSDDRKIAAFRYGLSATIKNRLAAQLELPTKYSRFLRVVQQLSSRSAFAPSTSSAPPTPRALPSTHARPSNARSDPMDLSQVEINTIRPASPRRSSSPRARSTSPAIRDQYRQASKCVRCGSKDHWVHNCPLDPYKSTVSGKKVTIAAVNDASDDNHYNTDDFEPDVYDRYSSDGIPEYDPGSDCDPNGYDPNDPLGPDNWERQLAKQRQ
jgi:hypothetical protein